MNTPTTVNLKRNINGEDTEFIVSIADAEFSIKSGTNGEIKHNDIVFSLDLSNPDVKGSWDKLLDYKNELLREKLSALSIETYVNESIKQHIEAMNEIHTTNNEKIAKDHRESMAKLYVTTDKRVETIRLENEAEIAKVRMEYSEVLGSVKDVLVELTESSKKFRSDTRGVKSVASDVKTLKVDMVEMVKTLNSLIEE